jgi:hypothetical protein
LYARGLDIFVVVVVVVVVVCCCCCLGQGNQQSNRNILRESLEDLDKQTTFSLPLE